MKRQSPLCMPTLIDKHFDAETGIAWNEVSFGEIFARPWVEIEQEVLQDLARLIAEREEQG